MVKDELAALRRQVEALKDCLRPFLIYAENQNGPNPLSDDHVLIDCSLLEYPLYVEDIYGEMRIPPHAKGTTVHYRITVGQIRTALQGVINPGS